MFVYSFIDYVSSDSLNDDHLIEKNIINRHFFNAGAIGQNLSKVCQSSLLQRLGNSALKITLSTKFSTKTMQTALINNTFSKHTACLVDTSILLD